MSEAPGLPPWSPTSPESPPWSPTSPDPPRSPAWTEYTRRSPAISPAQVRATSSDLPPFSPQGESITPRSPFSPPGTPASCGEAPYEPRIRSSSQILSLHTGTTLPPAPAPRLTRLPPQPHRPANGKAKAKAKAVAKAPNKHGYDQKTFRPLNLKALQTKHYEAKDLRRLDIEIEAPPHTYIDAYGKTRTHRIGRREQRYTRWLPADSESFMFGEEERTRAIEKEKKWRQEHGWDDLGKKEMKGKSKEVTDDVVDNYATTSTPTKRKFDDSNDLPDGQTPTSLTFRVDADQALPPKKVLRDFKSSCMDGRTIRVYQETGGDSNTPRSFGEKYPGLTYDTVVQRKGDLQDSETMDGDIEDETVKDRAVARSAGQQATYPAAAAILTPATAPALHIGYSPAEAAPPTTQTPTAPIPPLSDLVSKIPSWASDPIRDEFTIHTTYTTLISKGQDSSVFTKEDLSLAEGMMPHLGKHQRRKLRKRLGIKCPTNTRQHLRGNTHGGTPKSHCRRRGIPIQPRGPKKSRQYDCRDGVLGNCPPDCAGRLYKENGKVEQRGKARSMGVLLFGQGVGVGEWHSNEVVGRARGHEGRSKRKKGKGTGMGKEREESVFLS